MYFNTTSTILLGLALAAGFATASAQTNAQQRVGPAQAAPPNDRDLAADIVIERAKLQSAGYQNCEAFKADAGNWTVTNELEVAVSNLRGSDLAAAPFVKGEYETTAEFSERVTAAISKYVAAPDKMSFVIPIDGDHQRFDADASLLTVVPPMRSGNVALFSLNENLPSRDARRPTAQIPLSQILRLHAVDDEERWTSEFVRAPQTVSLSREEAFALRDNLSIVILAKAVAPTIEREGGDFRVDTWHARPRCVYLFDKLNRRFLHTYFEEGSVLAGGIVGAGTGSWAKPISVLITNPDWLRQPTPAEASRLFPELAEKARRSGSATIHCIVTDAGALSDCSVASEAPVGLGFGEAALRASNYYRLRSMTKDGKPVGGMHINLPIRFGYGL